MKWLKYKSVAAPVMVFLMVALVWYRTGIYFETNDDKCITEILCGRMTGSPDAHAVYVSYLLSLPLSLLYRAAPAVPWYGMVLVLYQIFAYTAVLESVYSRCRRAPEFAAGTALAALILLMNLYLLGCIQYTSTAALLAAAGYFCLLVQADRRKGWVTFCLSQLLAGLLRINAMMMVQPMGILLMGGALAVDHKLSWRERLAAMGRVLLASVAVLLAVIAVHALAYRGSGWKDYMNYVDAQTVIFDYEGLPPYGEVREILDRYQVSEADYYAYASYMMPDWMLPPECAEEVAAYLQGKKVARDAGELWEELAKNLFEDPHWEINSVLAVLWAGVAALILLMRERSLFLPALGLLTGKLFSWFFLLYQGRFPMRVSMPLLAEEILLLLALLLRGGTTVWLRDRTAAPAGRRDMGGSRGTAAAGQRYLRRCVWAALLLLLCAAGIRTGRRQYSYVLEENRGQQIFMDGLRDIGAYCNAHPGNRYIVDGVSFGYYRGSALEYEIYRERNYIIAGTWYSNSPELRKYNAEYLSEGEGFYFIIYDSGAGMQHPCIDWLIQETGVQPELCERITVSHGGSYLICYFDGDLHIGEA